MDKSRLLGASKEEKKGFTIIEVMIFLAISGLLLIGVLGGTYASIATQRYNDSVRNFAEFLRQIYAEVISPESLGDANGGFGGNSDDAAIYGKVAVFGLNNQSTIYTATLVGNVDVPSGDKTFVGELAAIDAKLFCGIEDTSGKVLYDTTVTTYDPLWEAQIHDTKGGVFKGTLIIARSPTSGTVHTIYSPNLSPDLAAANGCRPGSGNQTASSVLSKAIQDDASGFSSPSNFQTTDVNFCIKSDQSKIVRDVMLASDGHNNTAINLLDDAEGSRICR